MEYISLGKGGLLTILIPLNFLIGEYTLFFKQNGKKRVKLHCVIFVFFVVIAGMLILAGDELYYPFMLIGGTLIGIVQQEWIYRKDDINPSPSEIDVLLKTIRAWFGVIILIVVSIVSLLFPFVFLDLPIWDRWISYGILLSLSFELIIFNCVMIKKYRKEILCRK